MAAHRFAVGDNVRIKGGFGAPPSAADMFRVTATMPPAGTSLQYRIRNEEERHERVAREENLEAVVIADAVGVAL